MEPSGWFGRRLRRLEDPRLLRGAGRYVDDLPCPGALHAAFLRSPYAHARILRVDLSRAREAGAVAAFQASDLGPVWQPFPIPVPHRRLRGRNTVPLAREKVRYVGEPVAVLVAKSRALAEDALEALRVDYEVLPAAVHPLGALRPESPLVHEDLGDNLAARLEVKIGDGEGELKKAPLRETLRLTIQRGGGEAMETRGILASYDRIFDHLTVYSSTQSPHLIRRDIAFLLSRPESSIDVISPDVGGGFGPKAYTYPEDLVVPWLALQLGGPVKWIEDRLEHIQTTLQEREQVHEVEFGFDGEGHLLALRVRSVSDIGAYVPWGIVVPLLTLTNIPGPYRIGHYDGLMDVAYTHRVPIAPVRGAGRPQSTFVIERVMDRIAEVLGLDPAEVRYRNFIQPEDFPYETGIRSRDGTMLIYDSGDYPRLLRLALERAGYDAFRRGKRHLGEEGDPSAGRYVGIGISCNVEMTGTGPFEGARVRIDPSGKVFLATGAAPQGQGHETVLAQVLADVLGVSPEDVTVVTGDTRAIPYGVGTFASRTAVMASGAVINAGRAIREKVLTLAAERLEVRREDLEMAGGAVFVKGTPDRKLTLGELALLALGPAAGMMRRSEVPAGLEATDLFAPSTAATAYGAHVAVVEVDAETGFVRVLRYVAGHDCGRLINPLLVEGQVHGGVVHGIGDALIEEVVFDEGGQPLASTFLDYLLPLATDAPWMEEVHLETPSPFNPAGVKGAGEAGTIASPAAIANAIADALRPLGVPIHELPLTPYRLRRLIEQALEAKKP